MSKDRGITPSLINKLVNDLLKFNKLNLSFCDIKSNNMAY